MPQVFLSGGSGGSLVTHVPPARPPKTCERHVSKLSSGRRTSVSSLPPERPGPLLEDPVVRPVSLYRHCVPLDTSSRKEGTGVKKCFGGRSTFSRVSSVDTVVPEQGRWTSRDASPLTAVRNVEVRNVEVPRPRPSRVLGS